MTQPTTLALTRLRGESVVIRVPGQPDPIIVTIATHDRGDKVRLAFKAHRDVQINRAEVDAKIQAAKQEAAA